jgi:hypothetical protein
MLQDTVQWKNSKINKEKGSHKDKNATAVHHKKSICEKPEIIEYYNLTKSGVDSLDVQDESNGQWPYSKEY